jgi:hypothetical protein
MKTSTAVTLLLLTGFVAANAALVAGGRHDLDPRGIGIMLGAGLTLAVYSFLYGDNPVFRVVEHVYVGLGMAVTVTNYWYQVIKRQLLEPLFPRLFVGPGEEIREPDYWLLVPLVAGLLLMASLLPANRGRWISRWAFAFYVAVVAGLAVPQYLETYLLKQAYATVDAFTPDSGLSASAQAVQWLDAGILLVGFLSVLVYFFYSVEHRGAVGMASRLGIGFLMVALGASFGYTVMGRVALLIQRMRFLLGDWLGLVSGV